MYQSISFCDFRDAFYSFDRLDNFSYRGTRVLFDYLEQYEEDTGEKIELDVIALCCEYAENTWQEIAYSYNIDLSDIDDDANKEKEVRAYLEYHTILVGDVPGGFIYADF